MCRLKRGIIMSENKNNKLQEVKVDSCKESKIELPKIAEVKVSKKTDLFFLPHATAATAVVN